MPSPEVNRAELDKLLARLAADSADGRLDPIRPWPGGWPEEAEAALIDAIFSIRARYGGETTGVRRMVRAWRDVRGGTIDDLPALAGADPSEMAEKVGNRSKVAGRLKTVVVVDAAAALVDAGLRHAADLEPDGKQRSAYCSVQGCGPVTWSYFCMLLGRPGVKPDTWVVRYVRAALGNRTTSKEAGYLVTAAARELGVSATNLDHAIWGLARSRRRQQ